MRKLIGQRFGMLSVVSSLPLRKYLCHCDCGNSVEVWGRDFAKGKTDCGCVRFKANDLSGMRFVRLFVLGPVFKNRFGNWRCRCDCGKDMVVKTSELKFGKTNSCGCWTKDRMKAKKGKTTLNLGGERFGRLVAKVRVGIRWNKALWLCQCDCGKESVVGSGQLRSGKTKSCGCYQREVVKKMMTNHLLTEEEREEQKERRNDPRLMEWKIEVFKKDGRACLVCGYNGRDLVAHHKESWNSNKDKRFEITNGATSCRKCHKEFHSIWGYGDNTEVEWNEFLKFKNSENRVIPIRVRKRRKSVDLIGSKFNRLEVVGKDDSQKQPYWICKCDCGTVKSVSERQIISRKTKSCGCLRNENCIKMGRGRLKDIMGKRYGKLLVVNRLHVPYWLCRCDCGNERIVVPKNLYDGVAIDCQSSKNGNKCSLRGVA